MIFHNVVAVDVSIRLVWTATCLELEEIQTLNKKCIYFQNVWEISSMELIFPIGLVVAVLFNEIRDRAALALILGLKAHCQSRNIVYVYNSHIYV